MAMAGRILLLLLLYKATASDSGPGVVEGKGEGSVLRLAGRRRRTLIFLVHIFGFHCGRITQQTGDTFVRRNDYSIGMVGYDSGGGGASRDAAVEAFTRFDCAIDENNHEQTRKKKTSL